MGCLQKPGNALPRAATLVISQYGSVNKCCVVKLCRSP